MKKFNVLVEWNYTAQREVYVEAEDDAEATEKALLEAEEDGHLWEPIPNDVYVMGVTEEEEDVQEED